MVSFAFFQTVIELSRANLYDEPTWYVLRHHDDNSSVTTSSTREVKYPSYDMFMFMLNIVNCFICAADALL